MKHFLVIITYIVPLEKIDEILSQHRKFLQEGYDKNILLMSGPMNPRSGGVVLARAQTSDIIIDFFNFDPYKVNNYATYSFSEFDPVKHQEFLNSWVNGK